MGDVWNREEKRHWSVQLELSEIFFWGGREGISE